MEMTSTSCEIGYEPWRYGPYRSMGLRHQQVKFGYIPSDILGIKNIRPSTLR